MKNIVVILAILFIGKSVNAQRSDFFSYQNRLSFANYLYCEGDYLRAFDEYRALLSGVPNDTLRLYSGICLQKLKRYDEAEDYFKSMFYFSNLSGESKCEFYKTKFIRGEYGFFFSGKEFQPEFPRKYKRELLKLKYFSLFYLPQKKMPDSLKLLELYDYNEARTIAKFYYESKHLPYKDPTTAALLSAIIPGAGKMFVGKYSDGITSFIFSGLFYGLAAYKFSDNKTLAGVLFAGVGLFFHAGSVYGSAAAAKLYNETANNEFVKELDDYVEKENYFLPSFGPECK